jgi:uncharacterized membrane protein YphA (DoxX/SURF4 family)
MLEKIPRDLLTTQRSIEKEGTYTDTKRNRQWTWLQWVLRVVLGGILLASALGKSFDLPGFVQVLVTYRAFPDWSLWPVALLITTIEWVLGLWVLSGCHRPKAALATVLLNGVYAVWMTVSLYRGLDLPNCGCYGVYFPQPLRWYSPLEDLVLVALGLAWWRLAEQPAASVLGSVFGSERRSK